MSQPAPRVQEVTRRLTRYERVVFAAVVTLTIGGVAWEFTRIAAHRRKPATPVEATRPGVLKTDTASAAPGVSRLSVH